MKVFFAIPCYGQQLFMHTAAALNHTILELAFRGIMPVWSYQAAVLPHVRNFLFKTFLEQDATHLFWIDADIGFKPSDVLKLLKLDLDIVVANYWKKQPTRESTIGLNGEWLDVDKYTEPMEIDGAGMGFCVFKREVVEKLEESAPKNGGIPCIAETGVVGGALCETEDQAVFKKAQMLGYKVVLDPTIKLVHYGIHPYT